MLRLLRRTGCIYRRLSLLRVRPSIGVFSLIYDCPKGYLWHYGNLCNPWTYRPCGSTSYRISAVYF